MNSKDETYDPDINIDDVPELNNQRDKLLFGTSHSADLTDSLVYNDFERVGGPQGFGQCHRRVPCQNEATHDGGHYSCSIAVPRRADWKETHRFCESCATKLRQCPFCMAPAKEGLVAQPLVE